MENSEIVWRFAKPLSAGPRPYFVRGDNLVVFCFATPEDADAFGGHFDGERLPVTPRWHNAAFSGVAPAAPAWRAALAAANGYTRSEGVAVLLTRGLEAVRVDAVVAANRVAKPKKR